MIGNIINPISVLKRVLESVSSIFGWIFTATVVIFSAFVIYFGFYLLYVPAKQHIKPVHFEFNTHGYSSELHSMVPHALINLRDHDLEGDRVLARGQQYFVSLILHLPLSEENKNVGMFMTTLKFLSKDKQEVGKVSRSALMPYSSPIVSTLSSLLNFFFLHWRWKQESEKLNIVLFEKFIDDSYHPAEYALITIYCETLQIYSAELRIDAVFSGIRYYMFYWPFSSAVFGITSNLFVGIIVAIWLYFKFCKDYDSDEESEESFEIDDIGYFLNTDTESLATNLEEAHLEPTEGSIENQSDRQAVQRQSVDSRLDRPRHFPLQRLVNNQSRNFPFRESNKQPVPLTRRFRPARSVRDQACQTDSLVKTSLPGRPKIE